MLFDLWPLFGLRISTPRLILRPATDDDFPALIEVVRGGIHEPETMPFSVPWTDEAPPYLERGALQYWWSCRASWTIDRWSLGLAVFVDEQPIGFQDLRAVDFEILRSIETASWLGRSWQGKGIGTEMRQAVLEFAFDYLNASRAESSAFLDNLASQRVSERLGYKRNGVITVARRGLAAEQQRYLLTRQQWTQHCTPIPIVVTGFEACRDMFGAVDPTLEERQ